MSPPPPQPRSSWAHLSVLRCPHVPIPPSLISVLTSLHPRIPVAQRPHKLPRPHTLHARRCHCASPNPTSTHRGDPTNAQLPVDLRGGGRVCPRTPRCCAPWDAPTALSSRPTLGLFLGHFILSIFIFIFWETRNKATGKGGGRRNGPGATAHRAAPIGTAPIGTAPCPHASVARPRLPPPCATWATALSHHRRAEGGGGRGGGTTTHEGKLRHGDTPGPAVPQRRPRAAAPTREGFGALCANVHRNAPKPPGEGFGF